MSPWVLLCVSLSKNREAHCRVREANGVCERWDKRTGSSQSRIHSEQLTAEKGLGQLSRTFFESYEK